MDGIFEKPGRPAEAQLTTARMLLAQFITQIEEFDGMNREQRRTPRGRDLSSRIVGLREGREKWQARVDELEPQAEAEREEHAALAREALSFLSQAMDEEGES